MNKTFDFEQIGKRMPYTVPDGFFEQMEQNVLAAAKPAKKGRTVRMIVRAAIAAAAVVAVCFALTTKNPGAATPADSFALVEQAYSNLSADDQNYLMQLYQDDLLLAEYEEITY